MGKKHAKKRYFCVKYHIKPDKKFDEFVELSKKKIGPGKMQEYTVVLDLVNKEVLKCEVPGQPNFGNLIPFESLYSHFHKAYGNMLDQFIK